MFSRMKKKSAVLITFGTNLARKKLLSNIEN